MQRIGVISDTHLRDSSNHRLPEEIYAAFRGVDMILHAGDINAPWVLEELQNIAPTHAVQGNTDDPKVLSDVPMIRRIRVEGCVIGMVHGDTMCEPRIKPFLDAPGNMQTVANALSHFRFEEDVNCIVYGHSHFPLTYTCEVVKQGRPSREVLLLNPGSPTQKRNAPYCSCAILLASGTRVNAKIVEIYPKNDR